MANPTPLPDVKLTEITPEDVPGSLRAIRTSLENVLFHLARIRSVIFDETTATALGGLTTTVGGLLARVKDTYVFATPAVGTAEVAVGVPLRVVATASIQEIRVDLGSGGPATIRVLVDGVEIAQAVLTTTVLGTAVVPATSGVTKDQTLTVMASGVGGPLVVQVRAG